MVSLCTLNIYSVDTILYPYALLLIHLPYSSSSLCLSCNLSSSLRLLHHCTKYFSTPLIFLLFKIFSTFYSLIPSTSTSFPSSFFCPFICSLYYTIQLMLTTGCILIKLGNRNFTAFVDTTSSIAYSPTYLSINFRTGLSLNTKSLMLNNTLSPFFHFSVFFLLLSTYLFISSYIFFSSASS